MNQNDLPHLDLEAILNEQDPVAAIAARREQGWAQISKLGIHLMTYDACVELLRARNMNTGAAAILDHSGITDNTVRQHWLS